MKIGIISRSEWMYDTMKKVLDEVQEFSFIITSKASPEFKYSSEDFKTFAEKNNINFVYDPRIALSKLDKLIDETNPEICLSVNYSGESARTRLKWILGTNND